MNYEEFLDCIQKNIESSDDDRKVKINHVLKNNGKELDGLVILEESRSVSPTIYMESFYQDYCNGQSIENISQQIISLYDDNKDRFQISPRIFDSFESVKDIVVYRLINYDRNKKLLERVPHRRFLDLALIYCCMLEQEEDGNATATIYSNHIESWGITEEDLFAAASKNTPRLLKSVINPMSSLIKEIMMLEEDTEYGAEMYILSNHTKIHGAVSVLYDGVLKDFAEKIHCNLYILPSSIHEMILLPAFEEFDKNELSLMVKEVNNEEVSSDEILSDHVYYYDRTLGQISI